MTSIISNIEFDPSPTSSVRRVHRVVSGAHEKAKHFNLGQILEEKDGVYFVPNRRKNCVIMPDEMAAIIGSMVSESVTVEPSGAFLAPMGHEELEESDTLVTVNKVSAYALIESAKSGQLVAAFNLRDNGKRVVASPIINSRQVDSFTAESLTAVLSHMIKEPVSIEA